MLTLMLGIAIGFVIGGLWMDSRHASYERKLEHEVIKWRSGEGRWQQ